MARELKNQSFCAGGTRGETVFRFSNDEQHATRPTKCTPDYLSQSQPDKTPVANPNSPHHRIRIRLRTPPAGERDGKPRYQHPLVYHPSLLTNVDLRHAEPAIESPESGPVSHFKIPDRV
ncbi:MAG: hypothetical protein CMJ81_04135 [Planctomycetaceae bacterium]|nr:hypothetical protein [Planctomycetaceae bacterium]MBP62754.1 hypothetical protein [Planctomycetaceae bacterium]